MLRLRRAERGDERRMYKVKIMDFRKKSKRTERERKRRVKRKYTKKVEHGSEKEMM